MPARAGSFRRSNSLANFPHPRPPLLIYPSLLSAVLIFLRSPRLFSLFSSFFSTVPYSSLVSVSIAFYGPLSRRSKHGRFKMVVARNSERYAQSGCRQLSRIEIGSMNRFWVSLLAFARVSAVCSIFFFYFHLFLFVTLSRSFFERFL